MRVRNESACSIRRDVLMSAADVDTLAKGWLAIDYVDSTRAMIEVAAAHFLFLPTFRRLSTPLLCLDLHLFFARLELGHGVPILRARQPIPIIAFLKSAASDAAACLHFSRLKVAHASCASPRQIAEQGASS